MTINSRMKEVRKALKLTQTEMSSRLGVSFAAISMLEREKNGVSEQIIRSMVREYGVNEKWLRSGEGEMFISSAQQEQVSAFLADILTDDNSFRLRLISTLSKLSPDEWALLEQRIEEISGDKKETAPE